MTQVDQLGASGCGAVIRKAGGRNCCATVREWIIQGIIVIEVIKEKGAQVCVLVDSKSALVIAELLSVLRRIEEVIRAIRLRNQTEVQHGGCHW